MTGKRIFDEDYCEDLTLPDGSVMRLRLARPADREAILEGFERLSAESRAQRWFYSKTQLTEEELEALVSPADNRHGAIVAVNLAPEVVEKAGIGMARFVCGTEDPEAAEIAITIVDDWQGLGIGRILLHRLLAMVSENGIPFVNGRIQAENRRMQHLLEPFVPEGGFIREDTVLLFRFAVPAADDPLMAQLARNAAAVLRVFKRMAEGAILQPLAFAEQHLESIGPKAQLAELRRRDAAARPKKKSPD